MTKLELRTALSVGFLYLVRMLGLFMVLPVIALAVPLYEGASVLLVGAVLGVYGLTQALLQIPFGFLSDRIGRRKVLVGALALLLAGSVVAALATDIYWLIAGRALQGCGAIAGTLLALMSDLTRVEQRSKSMAIIGGFISLSFGLAMVFGPIMFGIGGLASIFWFSAVAAGIGIVISLTMLDEPVRHSQNLDAISLPSRIGEIIGQSDMQKILVSIFVLHLLLMSSFAVFPLRLVEAELLSGDQALYYFFILIASLLLMYPLMRLSEKRGYGVRVLSVAILLLGAALALTLVGPALAVTVVALLVFFTAFNLLEVVLPSLLSKLAPAGGRGTAMGLYSTFQFLGVFAGGMMGGLLLTNGDLSHVMMANVALCVLWFGYILTLKVPEQLESRVFHFGQMPTGAGANPVLEQLSSLQGVIDVVVIPQEQVAYLKVDATIFSDEAMLALNQ